MGSYDPPLLDDIQCSWFPPQPALTSNIVCSQSHCANLAGVSPYSPVEKYFQFSHSGGDALFIYSYLGSFHSFYSKFCTAPNLFFDESPYLPISCLKTLLYTLTAGLHHLASLVILQILLSRACQPDPVLPRLARSFVHLTSRQKDLPLHR